MHPLTIGYNRVLSIACLVVGGLLLIMALLTRAPLTIALGVVLVLLGVLTLKNSMLRIQADEVQVCNPLGMVIKRYPVTTAQDLTMAGNSLRHVPTDKKIASLGFGADKEDVAALKAQLGATASV